MGRTALIVLAVALLVGSAVAFTRAERLKLARSPVAKPKFERHLSPACDCPHAMASLSLLLRRPERLDVSVVDADGGHVATLIDGQDARAGRNAFVWDGKDESGEVVPDGLYRLKVRLERDRRTILIPNAILVDTSVPRVRILETVSGVDGVQVHYRVSETARTVLLLNGKKVARGSRGRVTWQPTGAPPTTGLTLVAVDRAGNRSEPVPVTVATP
jgi:FlgD Ig-like domain